MTFIPIFEGRKTYSHYKNKVVFSENWVSDIELQPMCGNWSDYLPLSGEGCGEQLRCDNDRAGPAAGLEIIFPSAVRVVGSNAAVLIRCDNDRAGPAAGLDIMHVIARFPLDCPPHQLSFNG